MRKLLRQHQLHTVCEEARCPNLPECWGQCRTATFLILGTVCTRSCRFCSVEKHPLYPEGLNGYHSRSSQVSDPNEGWDAMEVQRVAEAVLELQLSHVVITSVTRDDLPDGGAQAFARTLQAIRTLCPACQVEVLIPDLGGRAQALEKVLKAQPKVLNHNMETVERLYSEIRPQADYGRSLRLLARAAAHRDQDRPDLIVKSGFMLGMGETGPEIRVLLKDLRWAGVDQVTLGQYLPPTSEHYPLQRYVSPEEFSLLREEALTMGFSSVKAGPLVRSSYHAGEDAIR